MRIKKPPRSILKLPLHVRAEMAMKAAVKEAIAEHARQGRPTRACSTISFLTAAFIAISTRFSSGNLRMLRGSFLIPSSGGPTKLRGLSYVPVTP